MIGQTFGKQDDKLFLSHQQSSSKPMEEECNGELAFLDKIKRSLY